MSGKTKEFLSCALLLFVMIALLFFVYYDFEYKIKHPTIYTIQLSELQSGIYAYRETAVSNIPACNYDIATICDNNGNIYTVKGTVTIVNTNTNKPYAVWEDVRIVDSDRITIYAPAKSVVYKGTINVR